MGVFPVKSPLTSLLSCLFSSTSVGGPAARRRSPRTTSSTRYSSYSCCSCWTALTATFCFWGAPSSPTTRTIRTVQAWTTHRNFSHNIRHYYNTKQPSSWIHPVGGVGTTTTIRSPVAPTRARRSTTSTTTSSMEQEVIVDNAATAVASLSFRDAIPPRLINAV